MSHQRYVAVLAHYQPATSRGATSLPADVAAELVRRLAAEPIRQGVIRMLPPSSVMARAAGVVFVNFIPDKLPPSEVENVKFKAPPDRATGIPRTHYLPTRREKYGDWQLRTSLLSA